MSAASGDRNGALDVLLAADVDEVDGGGGEAGGGEGDDAVLAALAVPDAQAALRPGAVREVQLDRFGAAEVGVEQREEDRAVAAAHHRGAVVAGEQAGDPRGRQGRHDRPGQADVAEPAEGVVVGVAGGAQPGAEAAYLAEGAVAGGRAEAGEADEGGDHVVGADPVRIQGRLILDKAAAKTGQRLPVGLDGAGRLAFDGAASEVGLDEGWEERDGGGSSVHGPSMDALSAAEVKAMLPRIGRFRGTRADGGSGDLAARGGPSRGSRSRWP